MKTKDKKCAQLSSHHHYRFMLVDVICVNVNTNSFGFLVFSFSASSFCYSVCFTHARIFPINFMTSWGVHRRLYAIHFKVTSNTLHKSRKKGKTEKEKEKKNQMRTSKRSEIWAKYSHRHDRIPIALLLLRRHDGHETQNEKRKTKN